VGGRGRGGGELEGGVRDREGRCGRGGIGGRDEGGGERVGGRRRRVGWGGGDRVRAR